MSSAGGARAVTVCPSCPEAWVTETSYDLMRDEHEVRMRHGDRACRQVVSGEAHRSTAGTVMEVAVHACVSRISKETRCLEHSLPEPPRPTWLGSGPVPEWAASPA